MRRDRRLRTALSSTPSRAAISRSDLPARQVVETRPQAAGKCQTNLRQERIVVQRLATTPTSRRLLVIAQAYAHSPGSAAVLTPDAHGCPVHRPHEKGLCLPDYHPRADGLHVRQTGMLHQILGITAVTQKLVRNGSQSPCDVSRQGDLHQSVASLNFV